MSVKSFPTILAIVAYAASPASAVPLVTSFTEHGTGLPLANVTATIVTSASNSSAGGTSAALVDEAFLYTDRSHEITAPRSNASGGLTADAAGNLRLFPFYLNGAEYVNFPVLTRGVADYSLDVTLSAPAVAFLMVDNRTNGDAPATSKSNLTDPVLTGPLAWVVNDGWARMNTGQMPNGVSDYLGTDEGDTASVTDEAFRVHSSTGLVAGSGLGLNNFMSIYFKSFAAGAHVGFTKQYVGSQTNLMYGVAFATPGSIGDVDGNGITNSVDYQVIRDNFNLTGATRTQGDLNGDTVVNFTDFRIWKNLRALFGSGSGVGFEGDLAAVPEPVSMGLLMVGAVSLSLVVGRRRRN